MFAVVLSGCTEDDGYEVVDSTGVATSSIAADMHVSYTGSQVVTVEVNLNEGPLGAYNDINLIYGDTLKASTIGDPANLNFSDNLFDNLLEITNQVKTLQQGTRRVYGNEISGIWYYATIDAKYRDKEFTLSLERGYQNDAPNSVVSLPPDFRVGIAEAAGGNTVSRSGPISVTWSPANAGFFQEIRAFVNCSNGTTDEQSWEINNFDTANPLSSYAIPAGTFNYPTATYCDITFGMEHRGRGTADPALHSTSTIQAHQYRNITIGTVE